MNLKFEWDAGKNRVNQAKHKIDFKTAALVFGDENRIEYYDKYHSDNEDRFITIGRVGESYMVLVVVYTERKNTIRIISARKANDLERRRYYDGEKDN